MNAELITALESEVVTKHDETAKLVDQARSVATSAATKAAELGASIQSLADTEHLDRSATWNRLIALRSDFRADVFRIAARSLALQRKPDGLSRPDQLAFTLVADTSTTTSTAAPPTRHAEPSPVEQLQRLVGQVRAHLSKMQEGKRWSPALKSAVKDVLQPIADFHGQL